MSSTSALATARRLLLITLLSMPLMLTLTRSAFFPFSSSIYWTGCRNVVWFCRSIVKRVHQPSGERLLITQVFRSVRARHILKPYWSLPPSCRAKDGIVGISVILWGNGGDRFLDFERGQAQGKGK